jgi:hypothetical protein
MKSILPLLALAFLPGTLLAGASTPEIGAPVPDAVAGSALPTTGRDWNVKSADNICGLRDASQLTQPAKVDFEACLEATAELKRIKDQGIDPKSAEGIQLRNAAVTRVTTACETVRAASGYCSVWKAVSHKDGRAIPEITDQVKAQL